MEATPRENLREQRERHAASLYTRTGELSISISRFQVPLALTGWTKTRRRSISVTG